MVIPDVALVRMPDEHVDDVYTSKYMSCNLQGFGVTRCVYTKLHALSSPYGESVSP